MQAELSVVITVTKQGRRNKAHWCPSIYMTVEIDRNGRTHQLNAICHYWSPKGKSMRSACKKGKTAKGDPQECR